jgi:membrane protease YdiL (CAAX protease family)
MATAYWSAARHPWTSLVFVVPLLLAYEGGVYWLSTVQSQAWRNGADAWLRWGLEVFDLKHPLIAPGLVVLGLIVWVWSRGGEQPEGVGSACAGMALESGLFAVGLWAVSRGLGPLLDHYGITLAAETAPQRGPHDAFAQVITFVGAGIYEEVLFRLILMNALAAVLRVAQVPGLVAKLLAAAGSALAFAAAHHIGPYGEPMDAFVFVFRTLAGLYFAALFQFRGFGIAVGAHAGYDVIVGVGLS